MGPLVVEYIDGQVMKLSITLFPHLITYVTYCVSLLGFLFRIFIKGAKRWDRVRKKVVKLTRG